MPDSQLFGEHLFVEWRAGKLDTRGLLAGLRDLAQGRDGKYLDPVQSLLDNDSITEAMVSPPHRVFLERDLPLYGRDGWQGTDR